MLLRDLRRTDLNPSLTEVDPEEMRLAMRKWATGVTVLTTLLDGVRHGMTVSSFTSISLYPPLVLASLEQGTRTQGMLLKSGVFSVTILSSGQQHISDRFAGRETEYLDRFDGLDTFEMVTGCPLISGGLAGFDCQVVSVQDAGNHTLFIGKVLAIHRAEIEQPLLYFDRNYHGLVT